MEERHIRLKLVARLLACLVGLAVALAVATKYWLGPRLVERRITRELLRYWNGSVRIQHAEFNYLGPVRLKGVELADHAGRIWAQAGEVKLELRDFPGLRPVVTDVRMKCLRLNAHFAGGRCIPPLITEQPPSQLREQVDLDSLIAEMTRAVADERGAEACWDDCLLTVVRLGELYGTSVAQEPVAGEGKLLLAGTIDPASLDVKLNLEMDLPVRPAQAAVLLAALEAPAPRAAEGRLKAALSIAGSPARPEGLEPSGTVELLGRAVLDDDETTLEDVKLSARLNGRTVTVEKFAADAFNGRVSGRIDLHFPGDWQLDRYSGHVTAKGIDLPAVARAATGSSSLSAGAATAEIAFSGATAKLQDLRGHGTLFVDDADLGALSPFEGLFGQLGLNSPPISAPTDAEVWFELKGPVATISRGRLANALTALAIQPAGTIDLRAGQVDLYVVGAPLESITDLMPKVPILSPLSSLPLDLLANVTGTPSLTLTAGDDNFTVTGTSAGTFGAETYTGLTAVDALAHTTGDTVTLTGGDDTFAVTAANTGTEAGITFTKIEAADAAGGAGDLRENQRGAA